VAGHRAENRHSCRLYPYTPALDADEQDGDVTDTPLERGTKKSPPRGGGSRAGRTPRSRTPRGEETRNALLAAAAMLFARDGYHETSVPDIVQAAGVGHGTFYEYFRSRREILLELTRQAADNEARLPRLKSRDLTDRIRAEIFWYLSDHVEHLELSKVWHEASTFDPEIAETRRRERARRIARVRKGIEAAGVRADIDADIAAAALTAMLEEFAQRWFVEGDGPGRRAQDVVAASETLSALWLAAVGLGPGPG
jgi:AcrR family transcriptional regulator